MKIAVMWVSEQMYHGWYDNEIFNECTTLLITLDGKKVFLNSTLLTDRDLNQGENFGSRIKELRGIYLDKFRPYKDQIVLMVLRQS